MMSFVNILFLWNSFGFWQFALTPLDYETNALPTEPLRLVEDYQFYFYERNSVIGVAFIVFPVTKFQKFSILFGIDDTHTGIYNNTFVIWYFLVPQNLIKTILYIIDDIVSICYINR